MDVVSLGLLSTASLVWRRSSGAWAQTVICKATFSLLPGESPLTAEQVPPSENDKYWHDDPARSLYAPSDLVPFKHRADVLLVGKAFAPRNEPVRSLVARLVVGSVDKAIEVHCDRALTADGKVYEGQKFIEMPLLHERAGGGPGTVNPVGIAPGARPDARGMVRIPNLQPRNFRLSDWKNPIPPAAFGPIAPTWPERARKLGRHAAMRAADLRQKPLPDDLDPTWFNAAPADQQLDALRENEFILLENMHREHARLSTTLPGLRPRARLEGSGAPREIPMVCDTLWIDTDRAICTLTWRGVFSLKQPDQAGTVFVAAEERGSPIDWGDLEPRLGETLDMRGEEQDSSEGDTMVLGPDVRRAVQPALPFTKPAPSPSQPEIAPPPPAPAPPPPAPAPAPQPPPMMPRPSVHVEPAPKLSVGEAAVMAKAAPPPPPPVTGAPPPAPEPAPPAPPPAKPAKKPGVGAWAPPGSAPSSSPGPAAVPGSALDASNAAAGASGAAQSAPEASARPAAAAPGSDVIELLWLDPAELARVRKHAAFKKFITEAKARLRGDEEPDAEPREKRQEAKDRRDVMAVLRGGAPAGAAGIADELAAAMEDGTFSPPLVLVDGILEFPFEEKETLKATMALVAPFTAGDKRLKEQSDTIAELLKSPWLEKGSAGLDGYTARLREAFAQTARGLPAGYLEAHTERLLLEQRHYQKRTVLGQEWIRALLTPAGASPGEAIPTYLPERLSKELPMFQRFRVRALVEVRLQLDQFEAHPSALRVVALGRVVPMPARR